MFTLLICDYDMWFK